jgi:hypothetical protein
MCQNSMKIIHFLGSLLICLFRLGFGHVLQMCVCACVSVRKGGGLRRVSHANMQSLCEMDWKADRAKFKDHDMLLRERVLTCCFFFFLFSSFFFLWCVSWLCVGGMSLRQVFVSFHVSWYLIASSFPRPLPKKIKQGWLWHHFKWVPNSSNKWIDDVFLNYLAYMGFPYKKIT